jgi:hypothetical protein
MSLKAEEKKIIKYLKHISLTIVALLIAAVLFGLYHGASLHYGYHAMQGIINNEGPYAFYENDSTISINHIKGNRNYG